MFDLHACSLGEEATSNLTTKVFFLLQFNEVGGLAILNKEESAKFGFSSEKKKKKPHSIPTTCKHIESKYGDWNLPFLKMWRI
jgi:hypothetical protein